MEKMKKKQSITSTIIELGLLLLAVFFIRTFGFGLYQVPTGSMETTMLVGERFFADKFTYWFKKPTRGDVIAFNNPEYVYSGNPVMRLIEHYVWGPANWTKRVIGIPGDTVKGLIEESKPVIYVNGQKLDEPYLNHYPLIQVLKEDPDVVYSRIEREIGGLRGRMLDTEMFERIKLQNILAQSTFVSYDPNAPFDKQPFYNIKPDRVVKSEDIIWPGTPIFGRNKTGNLDAKRRYWDRSDQFHIELKEGEYWCMGDNRLGSKDCRTFGPIKGEHIHGRILFRIWSVDSFESWWIIDFLKHPIDFWSRMRWGRFFQWVT